MVVACADSRKLHLIKARANKRDKPPLKLEHSHCLGFVYFGSLPPGNRYASITLQACDWTCFILVVYRISPIFFGTRDLESTMNHDLLSSA